MATFGVDFTKEPFTSRKFSFDSFVFPACAACNTRFAKLEEAAKPIFVRLLANQNVGSNDLIVLLDWLDKVRVGLWLGYLYLDKNPLGINPSFHIESRIGRADRMVEILKVEGDAIGLTFMGPGLGSFQMAPTSFALRVNGLWLVNASGISLCSQRLGFPYSEPLHIGDDHKLVVLPKPGSGRIMNPVERRTLLPRAVQLYQPIFRSFCDVEDGKEFLENDWVRNGAAHINTGYGKVFVQKPDRVEIYPTDESSDWIPGDTWKSSEAQKEVPRHIYDRIREAIESGINLTSSKEHRKDLRGQAAMVGRLDRAKLKASEDSIQANPDGTDPPAGPLIKT